MFKSRVAIVRCSTYEQAEVNAAVERGIELLGGINQFTRNCRKLLLKPNVLWGTDPERCVITHPAVLKAVALLFKGQKIELVYGDSPAGILSASYAMRKSGYLSIAEELGIEFGEFDSGKAVSLPDGVTSKLLFIADAVLSSDGVVSIPKLKTHGLTRMTGAIKNQYGCVPGMVKGEYHARFPDVFEFSQLIVDITRFVKPRLYVMDAVYAMEGNGPQSGDPKKIGALLLSADPVAMDSVACRIIDLNPDFVPTINAGVHSKLGNALEDQIELTGDSIDFFIDKSFRVERKAPVVVPQNKLFREIRRHFTPRPVINSKKCTGCHRCVQACPVNPKAIMVVNRDKLPRYDYGACIRCFCCHEMCPSRAIFIKEPLIKKMLPFASYLALFLSNKYSRMQKRVSQ